MCIRDSRREATVRISLRVLQIREAERVRDEMIRAETLREDRGEIRGRCRGREFREARVRRRAVEKLIARQRAIREQFRARHCARQQTLDARCVCLLYTSDAADERSSVDL